MSQDTFHMYSAIWMKFGIRDMHIKCWAVLSFMKIGGRNDTFFSWAWMKSRKRMYLQAWIGCWKLRMPWLRLCSTLPNTPSGVLLLYTGSYRFPAVINAVGRGLVICADSVVDHYDRSFDRGSDTLLTRVHTRVFVCGFYGVMRR